MRPIKVLALCIVAVAMLVIAAVYRNRSGLSDSPAAVIPPVIVSPNLGTTGQQTGAETQGTRGSETERQQSEQSGYEARPMPLLEPGTVIGDGPPDGWTHLIFKSRSRLAAGAVSDLPEFARELAEFIFYAMTVRVAPGHDGLWRFDRAAIGLGTRIGDRDVIISGTTHRKLGANLGPIKAIVLSYAEQRLANICIAYHGPTMAVIDTPTLLHIDGENRETLFRYLFLVEPSTGGLATIVWRIELDDQGRYLRLGSKPILMTPNLISVTPLYVDGTKITAGIPSNRAFAGTELPPGTILDIPNQAARAIIAKPITATDAQILENAFRRLLEAIDRGS